MKTKRTKRKNKYTELRAAIAAVRKVNKGLLAVLPQWKYGSGGETPPPQVKENVAAFFREHGKEGEEAVAAFLDALARFTFDEFPRNWPEVWRMVHSSREIQCRLRRHFPDNAFFDRVFHEEYSFFKAITPTARRERSRAYWELLRKIAGYSRRVLAQMVENAVAQCKTTRDYLSYNIGSRPEVPDGGAVGYEGWIWWEGNDGDAWTFVAASGPGLVYCAVNGNVLYNCDNRTMNNRVLNAFADLDARTVTVRRGWNRFEAFTRKGWGGMASATTGAFSWPGSKSLTVNFAGGESTDPNAYVLVCDRTVDAENGKDLVSATGDATLDGRDWMPRFGDVQVAAGATLNLGAALSCASLGGSGAVCGNVAVERVGVEARGFAGPLAVDGDVTLSQGLVELVGGEALRTAESLPVLTATGAIRGAEGLTVVSDGRHAFSARVSADGKSILLTCHRQGLMLLFR